MISGDSLEECLDLGLDIDNMSTAEQLALMPAEAEEFYESLTEDEWQVLRYEWSHWRRPKQCLPILLTWFIWLLMAGRGFGKTRTAAEAIRERVESGEARRICVLAPTAAVARDVVVEGESGILEICPPWNKPRFLSSKRRLVWKNGAQLTYFSSEEPELLRGGQFDTLWVEELCALKNSRKCWDFLIPAIRLGKPKIIITTTPKRRHPILNQLLERAKAGESSRIVVTRGTTWENSGNLADESLLELEETYADTTMGRQELEGEVLDEVEGAYWTEAKIDADRVEEAPALVQIAVGVDPAISSNSRSDENGIVVVGKCANGHAYVLGDYSVHGSAEEWGKALIEACRDFDVDGIKVETVRGGNLVRRNIEMVADGEKFELPPIDEINSQELDKLSRIELYSGLWEKHRVHHLAKLLLKKLENEMTDWSPLESKYSPNRIDALIMAMSLLFPEREQTVKITSARQIIVPADAYKPKRPQIRQRMAS
jgi:phage terminase large subunit-like protein